MSARRVVIVTGAAGDLGRAVTDLLVARGSTVVAVGRSLDRLGEATDRYLPVELDLLDESATLAFGHEVAEEHGRVDGLFHLVGGWRGGKGIVESDLADWDFLHDNIIRTLQHATRALHDPLVASGGRLAIVSSTGVAKPTAKNAAYVAAKAAAEAWTLAVADSFKGSDAAAVILRVMALGDRKGFTPLATVATELAGLWDEPVAELNGRIVALPTAVPA
ncbi:SDR family oxidoreductase [Calidifontibacter terrae]